MSQKEREIIDLGEHIYVFRNYFDEQYCDDVRNIIEDYDQKGLTVPRKHYDTKNITEKHDSAITIQEVMSSQITEADYLIDTIEKDILPEWFEKYPIESHYRFIGVGGVKFQKTVPTGGYHVWHDEHSWHPSSVNTILAWGLYLNTLSDDGGGETEFLYQSLRVKPVKGDFLLWPAHFTHMHRGNPPLKEDKYLATGWIDVL